MRQTELTLDELLAELAMVEPYWPRCLIINEVGEIFLGKEDGGGQAEGCLRSLLEKDNDCDKFTAFCFLSATDKVSLETLSALSIFMANPDNQELIEDARHMVRSANAPLN